MHRSAASGIRAGVFLTSAAALLTEVSLIRVFDVLFFTNISYMIVTCSLFAYGLAGVYTILRPLPADQDVRRHLGRWAVLLAAAIAMILPVMNVLPFNLNAMKVEPFRQLLYFAGMYLSIALPFFCAGRIFTVLFTEYVRQIRSLYFWDLVGAGLGSVLLIPLIAPIGPGGLLFIAAALSLLSVMAFRPGRVQYALFGTASLALIIVPFAHAPKYYDFKEHHDKRGVRTAREQNLVEATIWDPISKIDVINYSKLRFIGYDGGSQTSVFYPFDGDFKRLRANLPHELGSHFWQRGILASHMLKEGSAPDVLVVGSAGGQEIKAALLYGAAHVDGVELVRAVVDLGKSDYSTYIGRLFHHPSVRLHVDEGRNFLRASARKYDILQIFSNHTSSSVAAGTGAAATNYLQTAEAYEEYFSHLKDDGILHINHFHYPKMVTTAALAWSRMGRDRFERHVVVYEYDKDTTLPTLLIKLQSWTSDELGRLNRFFAAEFPGEQAKYTLAVDPLHPQNNGIPAAYFSGSLSSTATEQAHIRITPSTDDRPYFNLLEKSLNPFPDGIVAFLKEPFAKLPLDFATFYLSGFVALVYGVIFIVVPLNFSAVGRQAWTDKGITLGYFSCLGAGFIIIEFVFIQMFMHVIGSPLYTFSTILFAMLLSAGIGSAVSGHLSVTYRSRWALPFIGVVLMVIATSLSIPFLKDALLGTALPVRMLSTVLVVFPTGVCLGMPFPLGISTLEHKPKGAVAWAWGLNGFFTVLGGLLAVIFSIQWGFTATLLIACAIYLVAALMFARIRQGIDTNTELEHQFSLRATSAR